MKKFFGLLMLAGLAFSGCASQGLMGTNASGHFVTTQQVMNGTVAVAEGSFAGNLTDTETITIGADVYEADDNANFTGGRVQVVIGGSAELTLDALIVAINASGT